MEKNCLLKNNTYTEVIIYKHHIEPKSVWRGNTDTK